MNVQGHSVLLTIKYTERIKTPIIKRNVESCAQEGKGRKGGREVEVRIKKARGKNPTKGIRRKEIPRKKRGWCEAEAGSTPRLGLASVLGLGTGLQRKR